MSDVTLVTAFPNASDEALHWWKVVDEAVVQHGVDAEPLLAAGLTDSDHVPRQVALVRSTDAGVKWLSLDGNLAEKQAAKVAEAQALAGSIGGAEKVHAATAAADDGSMVVATMDRAELAEGLVRLRAAGVDPDIVAPAGLLLTPPESGYVAGNLGFESVLRGPGAIIPDEPPFRELMLGQDAAVATLSDEDIDRQIALAPYYTGPNLRSGPFTKKPRVGLTDAQRKLVLTIVAAIIVLTILIPAVRIMKLYYAADAAENRALAAARQIEPNVTDLASANAALDQRLASEGRGNAVFSVPVSALFAAIEGNPQTAVDALGYQPGGAVSARITAPNEQAINMILTSLQAQGYTVTAAPASGTDGRAGADITVRGY